MSSNNGLEKVVPEIKRCLDSGNLAEFETHGFSMIPLLHDGGDRVVLQKAGTALDVNDVAFCKTDDGRYVLHRVVEKKNGGYVLKGDNCYTCEFCAGDEDVIGVAVCFIRRGKRIDVTKPCYKLYVRFRKQALKLWQLFWRGADRLVGLRKK